MLLDLDLSVTWLEHPGCGILPRHQPLLYRGRACWTVGCSPSFPSVLGNEPLAVDAANPGDVGSTSRDFSRHAATGSKRPCYAVHPDDSVCRTLRKFVTH